MGSRDLILKPVLITNRKCRTFINRGLHGEPIFDQTCWNTGNSNSNDPTVLVPIVLGLSIFLFLRFLFKDIKNNRTKTLTNKKGMFLQDYVEWYKCNKDKSASISKSEIKGKYLIVNDQSGNILEEVLLQTAQLQTANNSIDGKYGDMDEDDLLTEYIIFHNKKSNKIADQMRSRKRDDKFLLFTSNNELIKTISIEKSFNGLNSNKSLEES